MTASASRPAIGYWIFNYMPHWEAASKEVQKLLSGVEPEFRTRLMALNLTGQRLRLDRNRTTLPLPYAFALLPWLKRLALQHQINHVVASAGERILLPRFDPRRTVLTVAKSAALAAIERNLPVLRQLRAIVVESERDLDLLRQGGVPRESTHLVFPGVDVRAYSKPPEPFTILFATSPLGRHDLLSRGIHLLIRVAQELPDVRFLLIWRERNIDELTALVANAGTANIVIRNGYIPDMGEVYDSVHATALPGLEFISIKPCPHSALESLAHGKPLLVSRPSSLTSLVASTGCGVVFEPAIDDLRRAIMELKSDYAHYQAPCHSVIQEHFREEEFRERHLKIYRAILAGAG